MRRVRRVRRVSAVLLSGCSHFLAAGRFFGTIRAVSGRAGSGSFCRTVLSRSAGRASNWTKNMGYILSG